MMQQAFDSAALQARHIATRAITPVDAPLLLAVYSSTRAEELAPVPWSTEQKATFLAMQFDAQHTHYQQHYPAAAFLLVFAQATPIGRIYVNHGPDAIELIDIALLPAYRRQGIGSLLMASVLDEGRHSGLPVRLYVEQFNPALAWYQRLGFRQIGDTGVYWWLEWRPAPASQLVL